MYNQSAYMKAWHKAHPEYRMQWAKAHPEARRQAWAKWYAKNRTKRMRYLKKTYKEKRAARLKYARLYRAAHPEETQLSNRCCALKRQFGITIEEYERLFKKQKGRCAICGATKVDKGHNRLAVDHCHKTKKIRGLLCSACNRGLGLFKDSPRLFKRILKYLERA